MKNIPDLTLVRIESKRLYLVPISMKYKNDIFKEFTPEITTFMFPAPAKHISETEVFIKDSLKGLFEGDNLQLVILNKETRKFIGCAGLHHIKSKTPEMGIWIKKSSHQHGYGKEAMIAIKEWADIHIEYQYILYPVADKNIPSRRIPESFGGKVMREYGVTGKSGNTFHCLEYRIYPNKISS